MAEIERIKHARNNVSLKYEEVETTSKATSNENCENSNNNNENENQIVPPRGQKGEIASSAKKNNHTTKKHIEKKRILVPVLNDAVKIERQSNALTIYEYEDENTMKTSGG